MTDLERILEDAYQLGRTDATLDVNDHDLLMPKMLAKAVKYQAEELGAQLNSTTNWLDEVSNCCGAQVIASPESTTKLSCRNCMGDCITAKAAIEKHLAEAVREARIEELRRVRPLLLRPAFYGGTNGIIEIIDEWIAREQG